MFKIMNMFMSWVRSNPKNFTIICDDNKISFVPQRGKLTNHEILWNNIERVIAFNHPKYVMWGMGVFLEKKDCNGGGIHVYNDMTGWDNLLECLPQHLVGCQAKEKYIDIIDRPYIKDDDIPQIIIFDRADPNKIGKTWSDHE